MEKRETSSGNGDSKSTITISIKFSGRSIPITASPESSIKVLKSLIQPLTNVLPRGQKLIFKGKVLADEMTLSSSELKNGAKVMLVATNGLHQGDGPIIKEAQTRPISRTDNSNKLPNKIDVYADNHHRLKRWKTTGVVALAECGLKSIPDELWACGSSVRLLDVSGNSILDIPDQIGSLSSMQKFLLNANGLLDGSISWDGLTSLKSLTVLSASQNFFTTLPPQLGALTSLRQLDVSNNKLTTLPNEIGLLVHIEVLKANNNRISTIPESIGECNALIEVDFSSNLLSGLPDTFGNLLNLKALHLSNNGLKSLPSTLFKICIKLSTLDLHNTEITMDILRQFEGWEDFDKRRLLKHQKQLDFRVMGNTNFDEGADKS